MVPSGKKIFGNDFSKWIFQQDNDPKHTSYRVRNYLANKHICVMDWPPQSPDLNPIENLWAILNYNMRHRKCNTEEQLWEAIQDTWNNIASNTLIKLIQSMPKRCKLVTESNGMPISY